MLIRYPWQKSRPVRLERGGVYFLEALMKEDIGGDHLSIAVRRPRRREPKTIPKKDLYVKPPGIMRRLGELIVLFVTIFASYFSTNQTTGAGCIKGV
jgi:hypothetical protein